MAVIYVTGMSRITYSEQVLTRVEKPLFTAIETKYPYSKERGLIAYVRGITGPSIYPAGNSLPLAINRFPVSIGWWLEGELHGIWGRGRERGRWIYHSYTASPLILRSI